MRHLRLAMQSDLMKRLITFTAAAALIAAPSLAEPAPLPFEPTPEAFATWVNSSNAVGGVKLIQAGGCELDLLTINGKQVTTGYWCRNSFWEETDPRGTRRCQGTFLHENAEVQRGGRGREIVGVAPIAVTRFFGNKNDCRWL